MGISGCTSCQLGGVEALKAYERRFQDKLNQEDDRELKALAEANRTQVNAENRPVAGATVGSQINLSV